MNTEKTTHEDVTGTVTVRVGSRVYELNHDGSPKVGAGKYPEGDCRRLGPQYVHYQRSSRIREERRGRMTEHARKMGFKSHGAMLTAQKLTGGERAPKHEGRSLMYKITSRAASLFKRGGGK